jgi:predicted dehydrogenase
VGIVGAGGMGHVHGSKYAQMPDVELHVFDLSRYQAENFSFRHGAKVHESCQAMMEQVDVVDICTPTDAHRNCCLAALELGKPCIVEKPMAGKLEDCDAMIAASKKAGVSLMPAQVVRYFPEHRRAHDLIKAGTIGRPASVRLRRGGKAPRGTDGWFLDHFRSGGVLLDLAVHEFDWLIWTLGPVTEVMARSVALGQRVSGAEFLGDYALATLTHQSGCISHVEATWMDPSGFRTTIEAAGSEGIIEYDSRQNPTLFLSPTDGSSRSESLMASTDDPYYRQLRDFLDSVAEGRPAPIAAEDGREAVRVSLAAILSSKSGLPMRM